MSIDTGLYTVVVDDESVICSIMRRALARMGCSVCTFNSGEQVLSWLRDGNRRDLIFTDTRMPGMNGPEWLAIAHKEGLLSNTCIIIMSGADRHIAMQAIEDGHARTFLDKPWEDRVLRALVDQVRREKV